MEKYINRNVESYLVKISQEFPVIMVVGPRQVGKSTLLNHLSSTFDERVNRVSFDDIQIRSLAIQDPQLFLDRYPSPLIIDEFQYASELLSYIKIRVDNLRFDNLSHDINSNCQYFLTGSQIFETMTSVSESLAGRVAIIDLFGLSNSELINRDNQVFLPDIQKLKYRSPINHQSVLKLFKRIFIGSFPRLHWKGNIDLATFYEAYIRTYLERDIRKLVNITDEVKFMKFLISIAVRTGTVINYESICMDADVSAVTAKKWLSILVNTKLVYLLMPFSTNKLKRLSKMPKLYFMDTGLACYLAGYQDEVTLEKSAYNGAIFETYVITEIIKSFTNAGLNPNRYLSYFRNNRQQEIDLIIDYNNILYPIEIKKSANPGLDSIKNFSVLNRLDNVADGTVLCLATEIFPLDRNNYIVPIDYI